MTKATGIIRLKVVKLIGDQTIDGVRVSFREDGNKLKGRINWSGDLRRYFDDNSGQLQTNRYF